MRIMNTDEIPEPLFQNRPNGLRQPGMHGVVDLMDVEKDGQLIDDAPAGAIGHILPLDFGHELIDRRRQSMVNAALDLTKLLLAPENTVAVHAEFASFPPQEIDTADHVLTGAFRQEAVQLGNKDAVLKHGDAAESLFNPLNVIRLLDGLQQQAAFRGPHIEIRHEIDAAPPIAFIGQPLFSDDSDTALLIDEPHGHF